MIKTSRKRKSVKDSLAVVDIGSNSVRLSIYRHERGKMLAVAERKEICRLAEGMSAASPRLNPKGAMLALRTLRSFRLAIASGGSPRVIAVATAALRAVRRTPAGKKFHSQAEIALGHPITIISGRYEAKLAAMAILGDYPAADGVMADMGGGSMDLVRIRRGKICETASLPFGVLTLMADSGGDEATAAAMVKKRLKRLKWLKDAPHLYAIGGSWRAMARVSMRLGDVKREKDAMHGYRRSRAGIIADLKKISVMDAAAFSRMGGKIRRRADMIGTAAAAMGELVFAISPAHGVIFSAHGLREGLAMAHSGR